MTIDTTGLGGKSFTIIAGFTGAVGYAGSGGAPFVDLLIDGSLIQRISANNSTDWSFALTGSKAVTATGGSESHTVSVQWNSGSTGTPVLQNRTLWAMAGKR